MRGFALTAVERNWTSTPPSKEPKSIRSYDTVDTVCSYDDFKNSFALSAPG